MHNLRPKKIDSDHPLAERFREKKIGHPIRLAVGQLSDLIEWVLAGASGANEEAVPVARAVAEVMYRQAAQDLAAALGADEGVNGALAKRNAWREHRDMLRELEQDQAAIQLDDALTADDLDPVPRR